MLVSFVHALVGIPRLSFLIHSLKRLAVGASGPQLRHSISLVSDNLRCLLSAVLAGGLPEGICKASCLHIHHGYRQERDG